MRKTEKNDVIIDQNVCHSRQTTQKEETVKAYKLTEYKTNVSNIPPRTYRNIVIVFATRKEVNRPTVVKHIQIKSRM